jgi:hypothetical protein
LIDGIAGFLLIKGIVQVSITLKFIISYWI